MLFVTNRTPRQSPKSKKNRTLTFDLNNTAVSQYIYFCDRQNNGIYTELMHKQFFEQLKVGAGNDKDAQILLYIHGFNNTPEESIFPAAQELQSFFDTQSRKNQNRHVIVVPLIWPCDDDSIIAIADDYWDDQKAADQSGVSFARMMGFFNKWRCQEAENHRKDKNFPLCTRRINVLAHSMGNRVLRNALRNWVEELGGGAMPLIFRNVFMVAPDVVNSTLESDQEGRYIPQATRNLVVYYAADDLAMPASKIANVKNRIVSKRLGMTGPRDLEKLPKNVYEVDCDKFNNTIDPPFGHGYFLNRTGNQPSPVLEHMAQAIEAGRVSPNEKSVRL